MTLIETIKDLMTKTGWSQNRLAHHSGTSQSQLSRLLSGKQGVRLATAERLREVLEVELARRTNPDPQSPPSPG